ncbi:MAG: serine/threonine-protein kinase, partial [bacterium]
MSENRTLNSRYTLEAEIGRGGMGVVYRAEDAQMRRVVAIKTLPSIMTHNQELMRRFNSEIQHASQLEHPNIARVYDVGEDAGTNYYVMQYIAGKSLRELLKEKGRLTLEEALPILEQVASALDYANSQGIVHRDIKPENILLNKTGNAYVVDFGIAKAAEGTRTTRGMLGTPEYMSPEQIRGEVVDGRSDQYSLAVVAYEMLTGQTPFKTEGDDPWAQIQKHLNENVVDPRQFGIILSGNAANSLFKSLNKSSVQRFEKCVDFIS